ncbi:MAG: hypothetical protein AEth_01714 [Candidatus Argoarchaeum ethanivorans]|uniref:Uncharacterized protein n=1 Tax=Candidatus Argoarchaeum ethanivorans TaxID=2608793 RepID=A0A8B3S0U0_9EURY|nr:MAG: hypothetical protein AEth_01714 [Candidatus Argoarchaeum ethanivorans]
MITENKQSMPANNSQGTQNQPVLPLFFIVDELSDEQIKNGFMSEEYIIELIASLEINTKQDDYLRVVDKDFLELEE